MNLIVAAMQSEIKDVVEHIKPDTKVLVTGVGKVNAAMKLAEILKTEHIETIYNFGFAGASGAYEVGDVVLIDQTNYHDFNLTMFGYAEGQVPGYPAVFKSNLALVNQIKNLYPKVKNGYLLTGDTFMTDIRPGNYVYDMEGAALYQVAHNYRIPIVSIKVISDVIGMENHIESYTSFEEKVGSQKINEVYQMIFGGKK